MTCQRHFFVAHFNLLVRIVTIISMNFNDYGDYAEP